MIQLEQQQHGEFVGGWVVVAYTNYLYPARWGWINMFYNICRSCQRDLLETGL